MCDYYRKIKIGNNEYTGEMLKQKLNLRSTDITIIIKKFL